MKKILLLLGLLLVCNAFGQESFKKYYCIPDLIKFPNGDRLELKREKEIKFDNLTPTQKDSIASKYTLGSELSYSIERTLISGKVTVIEKIKIDSAFYKKLSIKKTVLATINKHKGSVKFSENKLIVNPYLRPKKDGKYEREIYQFELENRQTVKLSFTEFTVSALTIPLKYRCKNRDEGISEEFSSAINVNLFIGKAFGKTSFHYREKVDNITNTWKLTFGVLLGASTATLNNTNTSLASVPVTVGTEVIKGLGSFGFGATYSFNKINVGGFYGYDYAIGDDANKWNYNKKPWLGIALGYSLFNF